MAIATYRGEKSVADLATRLYTRLTPRQREKAEAALLKANPRLRDPKTLPEGAVLEVPDLDGPRLRARGDLANPADEIGDGVTEALEALGQRLAARFESDRQATQAALKLAKSAAFKRVLGEHPALKESAGLATKALGARDKATGARQKAVATALKQALAGLEKQRR
ncbi:hypothetical protein [Halomonas maura]|uniref:hypothetical protein n=1 Tax=Halomonas maura TaxID=117606 RepID=UPI0025B47715|nr:hypothetical protein [Halomonas maura]MDN3556262.1 hypothetical protein [Halomonas maura]